MVHMNYVRGQNSMKYDAFISYRHGEIDQYVAEQIHRQLEAFKLPKAIKKKNKEAGKRTQIKRIFRDRDELPISNDLSEQITRALEESEFLIVICSKRLKDSIWCQREIESFIEMYGRSKILAVLVDGEPEEAFPKILLEEVIEQKNDDGTATQSINYVEPLAADVRGDTHKEINKKIKEEAMRLAAPLFECEYDELKQRHREQKIRKRLAYSIAIAILGTVIGIASIIIAFIIQNQSDEIKEQSQIIAQRYEESMIENSKSKAAQAQELLEAGDRIAAIQMAREVLPNGIDEDEGFYTAQAHKVLSDSSQIYTFGNSVYPERVLHHESVVIGFIPAPSGKLMLSVQDYGKVNIWEVETGKKIGDIQIDSRYINDWESSIKFIDDNNVIYLVEGGFSIFNIESGETKEFKTDKDVISITVSPTRNKILLTGFYAFFLYDANTYEMIMSEPIEGLLAKTEVYFGYDDSTLIIAKELEDKKYEIMEYSIEQDLYTDIISVEADFISDVEMGAQDAMLYASRLCEDSDSYFTNPTYSLQCIKNGELAWSYEQKNYIYQFIRMGEERPLVVARGYSDFIILDENTGEVVDHIEYAEKIVSMEPVKNSKTLLSVELADGSYYALAVNNIFDNGFYYDFRTKVDRIKQFKIVGRRYVQLPQKSQEIIVYAYAANDQFQEIYSLERSTTSYKINSMSNKIILNHDTDIIIRDMEEVKKDITLQFDGYIYGYELIGNNKEQIAVFTEDLLSIYSIDSGELLKKIEIECFMDQYKFSKDGTRLSYKDGQNLITYDLNTKEELYVTKIQGEIGEENTIAFSDKQYYAIANKQQQIVEIYKMDGTKVQEYPFNTYLVENMFFDDTEQNLYISVLDISISVLELSSNTIVKQYDSLGESIRGIEQIEEENGAVLKGRTNAYLINEHGDVIATIPEYEGYYDGYFYIKTPNKVIRVLSYTYEQLLEYADSILSSEN